MPTKKEIASFLIEIAKNADTDHQVEIASDSRCPVELLKDFSTHKSWVVREAVAQNENTPITTLKRLELDQDLDVQYAAVVTLGKVRAKRI